MRKANFTIIGIAFLAIATFILSGCPAATPTSNSTGIGGVDPNETAATVNGKVIKIEEVERLIKQQGQGQEAKLSPLELAQARLQVLQGLIQDEVLYQKAEKEQTVPNDDEVTTEYNRLKTSSGKSNDQFLKDLQTANETEASLREKVKKQLAVKKLEEKIAGKVEPPKDSEIDAFYNGNKEAFVKKKGVKLAAIVVDPADNGEGDTTKTEADAVRVGNEIIAQLRQGGDFAQIAREKSEDQSRVQGGDLGYVSEEELKQSFPPQVAATLMNPEFKPGQILPTPMQGKFYIIKLQERSDKDENLTLESPGIREQVTKSLTDARKQLLVQAYAAVAMNEAKIVNNLAEKVVANPNELSGARPANVVVPNANANANATTSPTTTPANTNTNAANTKPVNTTANKPAANTAKANANK
ncbi:MAG TPA: SurA N-terminal domain-containing protein [Pyrinomonadaceae bacterium]|nr:SurA N-terminal domain-containing protein [Pyrinomonadaceae bacterium]